MRGGMRLERAARACALIMLAWLQVAGLPVNGLVPLIPVAEARSMSWARSEDAPTLDPHAVDEGVSLTLNQQIYEPLMLRDHQGKTLPALADNWNLTSDPLVWEFRLRKGVTFHDGQPFTADDVVFSFGRARQPASELHALLTSIDQVIKVDDFTIRIKTRGPTPLLTANLTHVLIVPKAWTEKNRATAVPSPATRNQSYLSRNANGTGPFMLVSREPGVRTVLRRNDSYWGTSQHPIEIRELAYRPIPNDTERVQALVSGDVDFIQDVPINELPRLQTTKGLSVNIGPENRSIFLGLNVGEAPLKSSNLTGRNPLADKRVRDAMSMAINRQAIQKSVTLGQSIPTGSVIPSSVNGYARQFDRIPPHDAAKAKALLAEAGLAAGFSLKLDCPSDRFIRDEAICRTIAAQLGPIGIVVEPIIRGRAEHLAEVRRMPPQTDFYLMGLSVPTFDSERIFDQLFHTRNAQGGAANATRYSNPEVDRLTRSLASQTDFIARNQTMTHIAKIVHDDAIYIPLHIQTVAYAMKADISIAADIENQPKLKFTRFRPTQ